MSPHTQPPPRTCIVLHFSPSARPATLSRVRTVCEREPALL